MNSTQIGYLIGWIPCLVFILFNVYCLLDSYTFYIALVIGVLLTLFTTVMLKTEDANKEKSQ